MKKVLIIITTLLVFSCKNDNLKEEYTFLIRNPYGCTHSFKVKKNGTIDYYVGFDKNYIEDFEGFEIMYDEINNIKNDKKTFSYIDSVSKYLKKNKIKFSKDAFHYQLLKGKKLLIDSYADDSETNNKIKSMIFEGLPKKIDLFCESY